MKKRKILCLMILACALFLGGIMLRETDISAKAKFNSWQKQVLKLVNKERTSRGLKKLKLDVKLCKAAKLRSKEITRLFDHYRPNGTACFTVFKKYGITYTACAENIAAGQPSPKAVVKAWMHSKGHRRNILCNQYGKLGIACTKKKDMYHYYWAQLFTN